MAQIAFHLDQPALALDGANPEKPLYFFSARSGRYLADYHAGYFYEIRAVWRDPRLEWIAKVSIAGLRETIVATEVFHSLGDAVDYLQAEARTRGAGGEA